MGWAAKQSGEDAAAEPDNAQESAFAAKAETAWGNLLKGFQREVEEFQRRGGDASFSRLSSVQCRISSPDARTAVMVTTDLSAHTIEYIYEPEDANTAVPEQGLLSMRPTAESIDLYSSDQKLTSEQACRLILEPLLFPPEASPLKPTGT